MLEIKIKVKYWPIKNLIFEEIDNLVNDENNENIYKKRWKTLIKKIIFHLIQIKYDFKDFSVLGP